MTRLIAAIHSSAAAHPVCAMALASAPVFGADVDAVQVVDDGGDETAHATATAAGVPFRTVHGDPQEQLAAILDEADVVGLVLGTRDRVGGSRQVGHLPYELAA